jgi:hypothetical protein
MFKYFAYGLGIHSNLSLPEFLRKEATCDVTVTVQPPSQTKLELTQPREYRKISPSETIVDIRGIGHFEVRNGNEIVVTPDFNNDERLVQLCISGSMMATLLYQRGYRVLLHSSVVAVGGQAICTLGNSGDGKSSMAAALVAHGHKIVSDDLAPIVCRPTSVSVMPGYPQIKISPDIATALGYDLKALIFLHPLLGEYAHRTEADFETAPINLKRVYILNDSDELKIQPLSTQEAIIEIIRHTYAFQPLQTALNKQLHFLQCMELLKHVSVCRLNRPRSIPLLPEVVRLIESDVLQPAEAAQ